MDNMFTQDNTGAEVKAWLDSNGKTLLYAVIVAIAITLGMQFYQGEKAKTLVQASEMFDQYQQALVNEKKDEIVANAEALRSDYPKTAYATAVALLEGSRAVFDGRLEDAEQAYAWVRAHGKPFALPLATLRLAQVKVQEKDYEGALALLDGAQQGLGPETAYEAGFEELRGDIAALQGNRSLAGEHYVKALALYNAQDFNNVLLQMKTETYR